MAFKLDKCPVCGTRLVKAVTKRRRYVEVFRPRHTRVALINARCPRCPVTAEVFEDTGALVCFVPHQRLVVRRVS